ncbi:MAG TPA: PH domain-containing protein, partial [Thermoanaerobaculia bacterium]
GAPGSIRVFQAAPNYFRYQLVAWGLKQAGALWGIVVGLSALQYVPTVPGLDWWWTDWIWAAEAIGIASYVLQLPLTLVGVTLDFRMRWYIVTDRSLRVREGLVRVREQTMGFANIQNLSVRQGPLQRLLGIADLEVRTAGGGDGGAGKGHQQKKEQSLHLAYFRGVDNAEEIKTLILDRLRRLRGAGLGDPDEGEEGPAEGAAARATPPAVPVSPPAAAAGPAGAPATAAARELLAEARALRQSLAGG